MMVGMWIGEVRVKRKTQHVSKPSVNILENSNMEE